MVEQIFTSSTTWTIPKDWTNQNIIEIYGAGGGATNQWTSSSGSSRNALPGYAGGYNFAYNLIGLKPGDQLLIQIGTGGAAGIGSGFQTVTYLFNYGTYLYQFNNYNFVGKKGGDTIIIGNGGATLLRANGGGPGVVTWTSSISYYPYTINNYYPGTQQSQFGTLYTYGLTYGEASVFYPYPPVTNGLLINTPGSYGSGGQIGLYGTNGQPGQNGIVAISYISSVTHSPCVWIS